MPALTFLGNHIQEPYMIPYRPYKKFLAWVQRFSWNSFPQNEGLVFMSGSVNLYDSSIWTSKVTPMVPVWHLEKYISFPWQILRSAPPLGFLRTLSVHSSSKNTLLWPHRVHIYGSCTAIKKPYGSPDFHKKLFSCAFRALRTSFALPKIKKTLHWPH